MRVVEKEVFQFEELDEGAKEKVRDWYREGAFNESYAWEFVFDHAVRMGEIIGIDIDTHPVKLMGGGTCHNPTIYFSGFWSQGDGACFEGSYHYRKGASKTIRKEAPDDKELHRIADELQDIQRRHFYKLTAVTAHRGYYNHSGCMQVSVEHDDDRYRDIGDAEDVVTQCLRDFADWIYAQLQAEYEYQASDEVVDENIVSNGYEFNEDGSIY